MWYLVHNSAEALTDDSSKRRCGKYGWCNDSGNREGESTLVALYAYDTY
jgi:hypothetical protein